MATGRCSGPPGHFLRPAHAFREQWPVAGRPMAAQDGRSAVERGGIGKAPAGVNRQGLLYLRYHQDV
jgi:hypothetical protein